MLDVAGSGIGTTLRLARAARRVYRPKVKCQRPEKPRKAMEMDPPLDKNPSDGRGPHFHSTVDGKRVKDGVHYR